jgi:type II secretory ATPase GspE/PulE/Tfp pilus assembly ATPase PilB-like protein
MCDLDISEKRRPQDGKIRFKKFGPLDIELRVATVPSAGGVEDVVMRILAAGEPIPIDKLGISKTNMPRLKSAISKPYGLFFVCGPTGSGKTTTLHSVLGFPQHARYQDLDGRRSGRNHPKRAAPGPGE